MSQQLYGRVFVSNIRLHAYHGVLPQERLTGNDYTVSVSAECPLGAAIDSDDVADTLNYAAVCHVVREEMHTPSALLEHVVGRICRRIMADFGTVRAVTVRMVKLNPPMGADCDGAGVELTMRRSDC